jgi:N-formylglutamate amidohydrolase
MVYKSHVDPTGTRFLDPTRDRSILGPSGPESPIVAHVPHAGTRIPPDVRGDLLLDDAALARELVRMTDWHTDALFAFTAELGATRFVNGLSRLVVDPERFSDDTAEPMAGVGQGAVYTRTSDGRPLRDLSGDTSGGTRDALLRHYFWPYHADLEDAVARRLEAHGRVLVLDCHSFATIPLPLEPDQSADRPEICIGTDAFHTPPALADALVASLRAEGFVVELDRPFTGAIVPVSAYGRDPRVEAVMIEVRRGLYCDESSGARLPGFDAVAARLAGGVTEALRAQGWVPGVS